MTPSFFNNDNMKKYIAFLFILALTLIVFDSCKHKKTFQEQEEEFLTKPKDDYNGKDTTDVMEQVNLFIEHLNNKDIQGAVSMLYFLDGDSIRPLPTGLQKRQAFALLNMRGKRYIVDRLVFDQEKDNEVKINVILFDKKPGDKRPNTMSFYLKPIRRQGTWYLTTADNVTDTNGLSGTNIEN